MTKLSCVIPAYNEAESLPFLRSALMPVLRQFSDWEIIVVNDGSTDATPDIVAAWMKEDARVVLAGSRRNLGKSSALMLGFANVTGDVVVTLDADLQDDPLEIPKLVAALDEQNADMVGGWKQKRHDPLVKVISSKVFNGLANRALGTHFHDLNCGLKVYRREVVDGLDLYGDMYRFIPLLATAQGWKAVEVPVVHHARQHGVSKYGLRLNGIFDLMSLLMLTKYRWRPLHFFGQWGALLFGIGVVMLVYLSVLHFQGQQIGERPLLIFGMLFVLAGLQLLFTGLLGDIIVQQRRKK